jgi:hypothetical protein
MIYQIAPVTRQTSTFKSFNKGLAQVRHIQRQLKARVSDSKLPDDVFWSPLTSGPFLVPVSRWIE